VVAGRVQELCVEGEIVAGEGERNRKLEKLHKLISKIKSRTMRCVVHVVGTEKKRKAKRCLVKKPEGNESLSRPRCR
jgi:hypothetical protein